MEPVQYNAKCLIRFTLIISAAAPDDLEPFAQMVRDADAVNPWVVMVGDHRLPNIQWMAPPVFVKEGACAYPYGSPHVLVEFIPCGRLTQTRLNAYRRYAHGVARTISERVTDERIYDVCATVQYESLPEFFSAPRYRDELPASP